MALQKAQIVETETETVTAQNANYDERLNIDTALKHPVLNNGRCVGRLVALEYLEPTGEIKQRKDGSTYTNSSPQLLFTLEVEAENTDSGTMDLRFWTNTTVDGVKDDNGNFSRLTRLFVALGIVDGKKLKPTSKVPSYDLNQLAGEWFSFKVELVGRIWKPQVETLKHIEDIESHQPEPEESKPGFNVAA